MSSIYKSAAGEEAIRERYSKFLAHWPVPNRHLRVPTREAETFVIACGNQDAPPLLLLHGSASNSVIWMGRVAAWAPHFRIYAIDVIGEPGFSAPSRPPLNSEAHALWLDDVMQALNLPRASIVGGSFGGWLAVDYATRRPDRVERLALMCPGGIGRVKLGIVLKATVLRICGPWGMRRLRKSTLGLPPAGASPAIQAFINFLALIHEHFRPRASRIPRFSDQTLQRLTMPVFVILGGKDAMLDSAETKRRVERNVAHAEVLYLPEAGHALPGQTAPILDFLLGDVVPAREVLPQQV